VQRTRRVSDRWNSTVPMMERWLCLPSETTCDRAATLTSPFHDSLRPMTDNASHTHITVSTDIHYITLQNKIPHRAHTSAKMNHNGKWIKFERSRGDETVGLKDGDRHQTRKKEKTSWADEMETRVEDDQKTYSAFEYDYIPDFS